MKKKLLILGISTFFGLGAAFYYVNQSSEVSGIGFTGCNERKCSAHHS